MNWGHVLKAHYNVHLDPAEVEAWKKQLREINTNEPEIIRAIEAASAEGREPADQFRVNVRDLVKWIKAGRAASLRATPRMELEQHHIDLIADWKCKLQNGEATENDFIDRVVTLPVRTTKIIKEIAWQVLGHHRL